MNKNDKNKTKYVFIISIILVNIGIITFIKIYHDMNVGDNWKREYVNVVEIWNKDSKDDILGYDFIYLNNDEIPELVLYCYDNAWIGFDIYTISEGRAVRLDRYKMNGEKVTSSLTSEGRQGQSDGYIHKSGILLQRRGMMGSYAVTGYVFKKEYLEEIFNYSYMDTPDYLENGNEPIYYEINYVSFDGSIKNIRKEEDIWFERCPELSILENEYEFMFSNRKDLVASELLTYDDVMDFLN